MDKETLIRMAIVMARKAVSIDGSIDMCENLEDGFEVAFSEDEIVDNLLNPSEQDLSK
jgi:hypothetical protein